MLKGEHCSLTMTCEGLGDEVKTCLCTLTSYTVSCREEDDAHFMGLNCLETAESDSAGESCIPKASYHGHCEEDE